MMPDLAKAERQPAELLERVVLGGNLADLDPTERLQYYREVCHSLGLNPLTQPFEYITLNGKLRLYARKDATDQLRRLHRISVRITAREAVSGVYTVLAQATDAQGRTDESLGAVPVQGLGGDALANALMKAETKAKRRVTLSIVGLGMLDESELETIEPEPPAAPTPALPEPTRSATPTADALGAFARWSRLIEEATAANLGSRWEGCTKPETWAQFSADQQTMLIDTKDRRKRDLGLS